MTLLILFLGVIALMINEYCIIGGGAIGGILAYYVYRGSGVEPIVYYGSRESVEVIDRYGGLFIEYMGREYYVPVIPRYYREPLGKCYYIFNSVKAYSVEDTVGLMKQLVINDSLITMFQNGFGSLELVEELFPMHRVVGAVVFIGATRISRERIIHNGGETIFVGCRNKLCHDLDYLSWVMRRGGCDFRVVGDIDFYRWLKLAVNAVINPLTAITRSRNEIVLTKNGLELAEKILDELVIVAKKHGYMLERDRLLRIVLRSARNTAKNYSSMAQDIMRGGKTEIDYINGYIASYLGERTINWLLTKLIHMIEEYKVKE